MDPALLRERDAFRKKAMQLPTVEKRKAKDQDKIKAKPNKKPRPTPKSSEFDYKSMAGSSQFKFGILAKIVKFMKVRHQQGDTYPLTIDEILDETNQLDIGLRQKHWLVTEALVNNPKIDVVDGDKFKFKPKYNIKDKKSLMRLLDKMDQKGQGGILYDDVEEALPNVEKALKSLQDRVILIARPDKKKVLFYNDPSSAFKVDEEIQKMWRSVTVDGVDERKIEDYLQKQGITSMQDIGVKKATQKRKKPGGKRKNKVLNKHNDHLGDILQDYSNNS